MLIQRLLMFLPALAAGHTTFTNFFVDGVDQGSGTCVRMPFTPQNATFPISSITSEDMACGADGADGVALVCSASAGSTLTFEFRDWPDGSHAGSLDASHKGPCAVYMKGVDDPTAANNAAGPGWFKVWEEAYDSGAAKWCTEHIMAANGLLSVQLPFDLRPGYYLVRPELLALQQADKSPPDPQFYVGCAQVFLESGGPVVPADTVAIPGYVDMATDQAAMTFSIYKTPMALPYPMFGPPPYTASGVNGTVASHAGGLYTAVQTKGLVPQHCVLVNANWCGIELDAYWDAAGCQNASASCWVQAKACYDTAPPTGSANCRIWEAKCQAVSDGCAAGVVHGPPDAGKILTPPVASVLVPPPGFAVGGATATATAVPTASSLGVPDGSLDECGARNASASCASGLCCSVHGYCGTGADYCG